MSDKEYGDFIYSIMETLKSNGFPEKKVSLPLEKMYEVAHEKGLNFNRVLDFLKEKNIDNEKTTEKIVFFESTIKQDEIDSSMFKNFPGMDPEMFKGLNMTDMMKSAAEMMKNMSPEQLQNIQKMYADMSPEQREELMEKAKKMGML